MSEDFRAVFLEEAVEHLQAIENELLTLDAEPDNTEAINAVFRAAHSIKGSAGMFGFKALADFTHHLETLLDVIRQGQLRLADSHVDLVLRSVDLIRDSVALLAEGNEDETGDPALVAELRAALPGAPAQSDEAEGAFGLFEQDPGTEDGADEDFGLFEDGADESLEDEDFGLFTADQATAEEDPGAGKDKSQGEPLGDYFNELLSEPPATPNAEQEAAPGRHDESLEADGRFGWLNRQTQAEGEAAGSKTPAAPAPPKRGGEGSLRVSLEKIDQLVNQVSELVITQAMLKETGRHLDPARHEHHLATLEILERNTRELQESVLSVRLLPVSFLFSRFPRVVRDLSRQLGKSVRLTQLGEQTELDKSLIEKLSDPLTHLLRNSIDHGIESPEIRRQADKPEQGQVVMSAAHEGGNIVLQISDDGAGLNREAILRKARDSGLEVSDDWPDERVWPLIFEPGFSTAAQVTDVSGRGVGMDVVRRNIKELGGSIDLESVPGQGSRFTIRLPLTLAITEGMVVRVDRDHYVLPLSSVVESLQLGPDEVFEVQGRARVIKRRGGYINLLDLAKVLRIQRGTEAGGPLVAVIVESEGHQAALLVDDLVGQQQIVIKNLEANYRAVPGYSGATVMGDGKVALILDVGWFTSQAQTLGATPQSLNNPEGVAQ